MHLRITALAASVFIFNLVGCGVGDEVNVTEGVTRRSDASFAASLAARAVTSGVQTLTTNEGVSEAFEITNLCLADTGADVTVTWQMDGADCGNGVDVPVVGTILTTQLIAADCDGGGSLDDFAPDWGTGAGQVDPANIRDITCVWGQDGAPAVTNVLAQQGLATSDVDFTVTVNNVRPIPTLGNDGSVNEGVAATFNGAVFDPGTSANEIAWAIWYFGDDTNTEFPNSKIADCSTAPDALCTQAPQSEVHTYIENGTYTAWLRVCDHTVPAGEMPSDYGDFDAYILAHPFDADPLNVPVGCRDDSTSIIIGNATPLVTAPTMPLTVQEGQLFNIVGSYTDAGADGHDIQWTFGTQGSHDDDSPADFTDAETMNSGSVSRPDFELGAGASVPTAPGYAGSGDMMDFMYHFCNPSGANQQQTIVLSVTDDDGGEGTDGRVITVVDAVPTVAWPGAIPTVNEEHGGAGSAWVSPPTMTDAVPAGSITEGSDVTFTITSSTTAGFGCDDVDPSTYHWDCGAAGFEIGGLLSCDGSNTCTCRFQAGAPGGTLSTVSATVQDDDGSQATPATIAVTVLNVRPASLTATTPINVDEGTNVVFTGATFEDPGFDSFIAEWNFGDGTGSSNQLSFTPTGSNVLLYTVNDSTPPHPYQAIGNAATITYNAVLTVWDEDASAPLPSTTVVVNVTDVSPTVTNVVMRDAGTGTDLGASTTIDENDPTATIQLDVTATAGGVDDLTLDPIAQYTIVWGDGSPDTVRTTNQPNETFVHDYVDDSGVGSFPITITVQDSDGSTHTYGTTFQVTVNNLDPVLDDNSVVMVGTRTTGSQFPATTGDAAMAVEGENLTFDATYTEQATVDTHTYTWDFTPPAGGTGGTLAGAISVPGTVDQGAFTFDEQGDWTVTLTVDDDDGGSDSYSFTVTVADVHPVLSVALTQAPVDRWEAQPVTVEITTTSGILPLANEAMDPVPRGSGPYAQIDCDYPGATLTGSESSTDLNTNFAPELDISDNTFPDTDCDIYDDSGDFWIAVKVFDEDSYTIVVLDENTTTPQPEPVVIQNVIPTPAIEVDSSMTTPEMTEVASLPLIVGGAFDDPGNETYWNAWWTYIDPLTGLEVRVDVDDSGTDLGMTYPTFGQLPGVQPERFLDDESPTGTAVFCGVLWVQDDDMVATAGGTDNNAVSFPDVGTWGSRPGPTGYPQPNIATQKCTGFTFNITNVDPIFTDVEVIPPQVGEGASITARVLNGVAVGASDIAGVNDPLTYTYFWEWGGTANPGPFTITSSPLASNIYTLAGTYTLRVLVEDDDSGSFFIDKTIDVINIPPEIVDILQTGPKTETEEISVAPILRSYDVGTLTYGYDWNDPEDGHPDNPALNGDLFEPGGPVGTHFYSQDGTYQVTVQVCDDYPTCVEQTISVEITNLVPVVSILPPAPIVEGTTGARMVVEAFDIAVLDEQAFTFQVDWGDGSGLQAATYVPFPVSDASAGRYVFDYVGSYTDNGVLTLRAEVNDGTGSTLASTAFTVLNADPVIGAITPAAPTLNEGSSVSLTIPVTDPGTADTFTFAVDWNGDGIFDSSSTSGTLVHTYMDNATGGVPFDAVIRVTDDDGGVDTATHQVLVNNVTPTLSVNGPTSSIIRGSSATIECVADEPGADALTYEWDWTYDNVTFSSEASTTTTAKSATRSRVYATTGSFTAACRVTDDDGATSAIVTRTVVVTAPEANLLVDATSPINEEGSTVLTIETASAGTFDFQVNWDDGSAPESFNGVVIASAGDTWDSPAHTYLDDGDYSVAVQSTRQSDGKEAFAAIQVLVNNLPPTITVPAAPPTAVQLTEGTAPAPFTIAAMDVAADEAANLELTIRGSIEEPTCATCEVGCGACGNIVVARTSATGWTLTWDPVEWEDFYNTEFTIVVTDKDGGEATQDWTFNLNFTDDDNDNLPDGWEVDSFSDCDDAGTCPQIATGDPDGDGITNLDEFLNGTNPEVSNAPTEPTLLAPVDRPVGELMPALVAANATDPDDDPLSYTFEVYGDEALTNLVWDAVGVTEGPSTTSVDIDMNLTDGSTYWWRARATDAVASGPWAEAVWFVISVDNHAPGTPTIVAPADGAIVEVANPYFEVTPVSDVDGDAVTYSFEIYSDSGLTTLVASAAGRALPTWFADPALANGDYWWFAEATDGMMVSQTTVGTFTVELPQANLPPGAPTIAQPTAGATVTTATPDLVVGNATDPDGDTLSYFFEVADNLAFVGSAASSAVNEGTSVTTWSVPVALDEDTAYFWRARAFDGLEAGEWALGTFVVNATNDGPGVPTIIAPATGAVLASDPSELVAGNATDPEGDELTYTFEVSDDAAGANILATGSDVAAGDGTTAWTITGVTFEKGTTYYWRVSASDGTTDGAFTAWSAFTLFEPVIDLVPDDGCGCRGTAANAGWLMAFLGVFGLVARRRRR